MENASKALLAAGGVLIAVIIITLIVNIFQNAGNQSKTYKQSVQTDEITIFNSNFTKYVGKNLTIHEVVTICNFAEQNNIHKVTITANKKTEQDIQEDNNKIRVIERSGKKTKEQPAYKIQIATGAYDQEGYISKISFIYIGLKEFE